MSDNTKKAQELLKDALRVHDAGFNGSARSKIEQALTALSEKERAGQERVAWASIGATGRKVVAMPGMDKLPFGDYDLYTAPQPASAVPDDVLRDAQRWRALIGSARVRYLGSAGLNSTHDMYGNPHNGYAHIGVELWTKHEDNSVNAYGIDMLTKYADAAVMLATAKESQS